MEIDFLARVLAPEARRGPIEFRGSGSADPARGRPDAGDPLDRKSRMRPLPDAFSDTIALSLSPAAQARLDRADGSAPSASGQPGGDDAGAAGTERSSRRPGELSDEEEAEVQRLRARDAEVRAHENAHKAAAGRHARGGPSYEFERGPDGRRYAVGGEVSIDTSAVAGDPDATIIKMQQVRRAALAPAEPSPQDRKVASEASRTEAQARAEKLEEQRSARGDGDADSVGTLDRAERYARASSIADERRGTRFDRIA